MCTVYIKEHLALHVSLVTSRSSFQTQESSSDSRGIQGRDKVDKLARTLVSLTGLHVTNSSADQIKKLYEEQLYEELLEYDKRPLVIKPIPFNRSRGRFGRKKSSSHTGVDHMKQYNYLLTRSLIDICTDLNHNTLLLQLFSFRWSARYLPIKE